MKKSLFITLALMLVLSSQAFSEDAAVPAEPSAPAEAALTAPEPTPSDPPAADMSAPALAVPAEPQESTLVDNLEFISGEVSELDEAGKSVSVRLYGENETQASDKILKVSVDENTDITDGEQDRDLKSLAAGTEVDVEYDPSTNKATYIFVY